MKNFNISIIDYGTGNILSVNRAFDKLNVKTQFATTPEDIVKSDFLILPGVGAFDNGMNQLRKKNLDQAIIEFSKSGKPLIGICLGMQLLMSKSFEFGENQGLGIIPGDVVKIPELTSEGDPHKIPHIGWNTITNKKENDKLMTHHKDRAFYFVHSYMASPENKAHLVSTTNYNGQDLTAVIGKENIYGCQFHPEKSCKDGLKLLESFLRL